MKTQTPEIISRKDAKAQSLRLFFTGKPCKRGNVAPRKVGNSDCTCAECLDASKASKAKWAAKNCPPKGRFIHPTDESRRAAANESNKRWQRANRDKTRAAKRRWEEKNPDKHRAGASQRNKRWGDKNKELKAETGRRWRQDKPHAVRAHVLNRRAMRANATPPWFGELDELVMIEAAHLCELRERATGVKWHADHMLALQGRTVCGLHVAANMQVIPASMNTAKGNKLQLTEPGEWLLKL